MSSKYTVCSQWVKNVLLATVDGTLVTVWLVAVLLVTVWLVTALPLIA